jgi:tetratricopeptide (TPR) repeat protein
VAIDEGVWERPDGDGYRLDRLGEGLSPSWWRFWLDAGAAVAEGLAGHITVSWYEARGDEEEALRRREQRRGEYVRALADSGGRAPLSECLGTSASNDDRVCRGKGAAVFGVLERVIGREPFCAALAGLTARGGGTIGLESVVRAFEDASGRALDWFFYEWFYRGDLPTYSLDYEVAADRTGPVVRGVVRQNGEIYRTPIPLTIELGGWSYNEWVLIDSSEQRFEFRTDMAPMEVTVDGSRLVPRIDDHELANAHFQWGLEAAEEDDWGTAVDEFGEAASLEWGSALYRFRYGDALVHSGRLAAGLEALESAVTLDLGNPEYRIALARLYLGALEHDRALSHLDEYVRLRDDPGGRLGRARALIGLGRLEEAREAIDEVRADVDASGAPDTVREELVLVLGMFHEAAGDTAAAVSEYERALEVNPVCDEARRRLEALGSGRR